MNWELYVMKRLLPDPKYDLFVCPERLGKATGDISQGNRSLD
jgi:hypothetical protein